MQEEAQMLDTKMMMSQIIRWALFIYKYNGSI